METQYNLNHVTKDYPFMSCILKVDIESSWQKTVAKVLKQCHGVHSFRINDNGAVEISGIADPTLLLKMLSKAGKKTELCWLQSGGCSSNLFMPTNTTGNSRSIYPPDGRYLQLGTLPRLKIPSHEPLRSLAHNHNHGHQIVYDQEHDYDHHANYYNNNHYGQSYGHNHDLQIGYQQDYNQGHGYPHSYDHNQLGYKLNSAYEHDENQNKNQYKGQNFSNSITRDGKSIDGKNIDGKSIGCCRVM